MVVSGEPTQSVANTVWIPSRREGLRQVAPLTFQTAPDDVALVLNGEWLEVVDDIYEVPNVRSARAHGQKW